ncbi:LysE family transporter [Desulfovibrio sp. UIB00]|uniref:LysE family translocator n=1 Tax=Desulfovibrio sp. UIB00 TaxID=2804314 RepID=UPI001F0F2DA2|nr:LysE family transporter [Desulfovibrio sp. UIB00]MCH5145120.1 LysE family transporter [Desulfovibrio sp. UIB00]
MSVSTLIPAAFPALALAHFLALLSPGPDFFLIIGHAVRHRLRGSLFICLGIALGNALYICLAVSGWSVMRQMPAMYRLLELAGAAYLAWLGFLLLRASRKAATRKTTPSQHAPSQPSPNQTGSLATGHASPLSPGRQLLTGLGSALLNPKNAVFYLTLMTVILGPTATLPQQAFAGLWMTLLVFAWDAALAAAISLPGAQRALEKRIPLIEGLAGLTLASIALWLVLRPLFY